MIRLGVNLDHIATVRNAREEKYPDPVQAAVFAELGGASNITCHLREDRRHIRDRDVELLKQLIKIPLNLEISATSEMVAFANQIKAHSVTLVPEKRQELTTEGGLSMPDVANSLKNSIDQLKASGSLVVLFVESNAKDMELSKEVGADAVELHTGELCRILDSEASSAAKHKAIREFSVGAQRAHELGMQVHVGHGLNYANAMWMQLVPHIEEANIGHAIIAQSIFTGLQSATRQMLELLNNPANRPL